MLVADEDGISTPELISFDVFGGILPKYIVYCLLDSFTNRAIDKRSYGIKMPRVDAGFMANLPIPIPPISEQEFIVDKMEATFEQIDKIDKLQSQYNKNSDVLKDKLIIFALQGKLTEQYSEDGTAEELFEDIQKEKQDLITTKKTNKKKKYKKISNEDIPFCIPSNWIWVRWGNLANSIQYGFSAPAKESGRIKMVRITDIQDNRVVWDSVPYCDISEEDIDEYLLHNNDILFARTGGTVGKSYIVQNISEDAVFAGYLIRTSYSQKLCPKYLKYFMESSLYWKQLKEGTITTAQPNCNATKLSQMILPLPPRAEQERIVKMLDGILL